MLLAFTSYGQVRNTKWGMSKQQVLLSESIKPSINNKDGLTYDVRLAGLENYLFYFFNSEGKLSAAAYSLSEKYAIENSYLSDYLSLLSKLKEKYGDGSPEIDWSNDLYKDDKQKWGLAIAAEHLKILHRWETEDTNITMEISGKNFDVSVAIRYMSKVIKLQGDTNDLNDF
jgi:hypothetical protein